MTGSIDDELARFKIESYRGIARIPLDSLVFNHSLTKTQHREISWQNVHRIQKIFERTECLRFDEDNIINAVISDSDLDDALQSANITSESYKLIQWPRDAPSLNIARVECLSGLHRIEAAKNFLDENDKWWVVRLFSDTTPRFLLTRIIESYTNEQRPADGEIFRKIRVYHKANDQLAEDRWWACLDRSKLKDLRQLLKKREILAGFDELIDMPGLWTRVQLGALHRLLALKCDEEMVLYLKHVSLVWRKILRCGAIDICGLAVDSNTVDKLESLCPRHSQADKELLHDLMQRQVIFPSQTDPAARDALFRNICSLPYLVPSLRTFFEMLKFLEPTCAVLKQLIGKDNLRGTIRSTVMGRYFRPSRILLQVSEWSEAEVTVPLDNKTALRLAYTELWAYCSRNIDDLVSFTPKKESGQSRPSVKCRNPVAWQNLASFSLSRGFRLPSAEIIAEDNSQLELALDYLRKANPTVRHFSNEQIKAIQDASCLITQHVSSDLGEDFETTDVERRVGRPFADDFAKDQSFLFLPRIFALPCDDGITHTFTRRNLFTTIFGCLNEIIHGGELVILPRRPSKNDQMEIDSVPALGESLEAQNTQLRAKLAVSDQNSKDRYMKKKHELEKEQARCEDLVQENHSLRNDQRSLHQQIQGLTTELEKEQARCEDLVQENHSLRDDQKSLHQQIQELTTELGTLQEREFRYEDLVRENHSLREDQKLLHDRIQSLTIELDKLQERKRTQAVKVSRPLQKSSLSSGKLRRKTLLAQQVNALVVSSLSSPAPIMDTTVALPIFNTQMTVTHAELEPAEQTWTQSHESALEIFLLTSIDRTEGPKGYSYRITDDLTAADNINRILVIVRQKLGNAPVACNINRQRIPSVEKKSGVAEDGFLSCLRSQRTIFVGGETVIDEFQEHVMKPPEKFSERRVESELIMPGGWGSDPEVEIVNVLSTRPETVMDTERLLTAPSESCIEPEAAVDTGRLLTAPARKAVSTKDKHRTQVRVVEERGDYREPASIYDTESEDELPRKNR